MEPQQQWELIKKVDTVVAAANLADAQEEVPQDDVEVRDTNLADAEKVRRVAADANLADANRVADAEDADVRDGRVALPRGRGCPPAAVWRPDLYVCEGVMGSKRVRSDESSCQENKEEIEHFEPAPSQRDGVTKNTPRAIERPLFVDEIQDHIYAAWCL